MTLTELKRIASDLGYTVRKTDGEFRVNVKYGTEDQAYYTTDIDDAYGTLCSMASHKPGEPVEPVERTICYALRQAHLYHPDAINQICFNQQFANVLEELLKSRIITDAEFGRLYRGTL